MKALTLEDLKGMVRTKAREIDEVRIFYTLRKLGIKWFKPQTINVLKYCIAMHECKLPIVTWFFKDIGIRPDSILSILHTLGDKHVLILKRKEGRFHEWILHPNFLRAYYDSQNIKGEGKQAK